MRNSFTVEYRDKSLKKTAPAEKIKTFLELLCHELGLEGVEFSVIFITEPEMREMNREYRDIDSSTDILSFAALDSTDVEFFSAGSRRQSLGDILICPDVMRSNAEEFGVSADEELHRLLIHGVLHLCGRNHVTNDAAEPMLMEQEKLLELLYRGR